MICAKTLLLGVTAFALVATLALAEGSPPNGAKSILQIVEALEKQGYGPLVDVSFDDGDWEVEAYKDNAALELAVHATTGLILSEHRDDSESRPPSDALKLSELLRELHKAGQVDIQDVSFERRYWEVETCRDNGKHELHVDPLTAKIISDRLDD